VPHDIVFDRSYIHGLPTQEVQRGIALNGAEVTVSNSYISEIHGTGYDTQALCGWNGPGPFHIINNYLEAAGENVMFGGALPSITNLIPSNIEIRRNKFFKPLSWKMDDPSYAGIHWSVKNWLEFKNAQDVVFDDNDFENNWGDAQVGSGWLFTVRSEDGKAPWATVRRIRGTNNRVKNTESGMQLMGADWSASSVLSPSQGGSDLYLGNNGFEGIRNRFAVVQEFQNFTLEHNTHFQGGNIFTFTGRPSKGFVYRNNVTVRHDYGIFGDGIGEGKAALATYAPDGIVEGNVIAGASAAGYPPNNFYPADLSGLLSLKGTDGLVPGFQGALNPLPDPSPLPIPSPSPAPVPSPVPLPSPTPAPAPLREAATFPWPSNKDQRKAIWTQRVLEGWKCFPQDGILYCRR
jgi:hypothetical protein